MSVEVPRKFQRFVIALALIASLALGVAIAYAYFTATALEHRFIAHVPPASFVAGEPVRYFNETRLDKPTTWMVKRGW